MSLLQRLRNTSNSLRMLLFTSFLVIILMLASFNFFSISFSKDSVREEVIKYNTSNVNNTTESYEKHFELIKNLLIHFYFTDNVQILKNNQKNRNYGIAFDTYRDIRTLLSNPLLHMDNLTLYFKEDAFILDKDTSTRADTYFSKFYFSEQYPPEFWEEQFSESFTFKILPAANFYEKNINGEARMVGTYIPFLVKNVFQDNLYMIAFMDANQLFRTFHSSINDHFYILNPTGGVIFSSGQGNADSIAPALEHSGTYAKLGPNYYFHNKGAVTGNIYMNIIPDSGIIEHQRMNATLISLLAISVVISMIVSFLFSIRFNQPIQRIAESIQHWNGALPHRSRIKEIDLISSGITRIIQLNRNINEDLSKKNALLTYYAYTNRLKKIRSHFNEVKDMVLSRKPYQFILFELTMKGPQCSQPELKERWVHAVKEYIEHNISQLFADALTFQIEENEVLSIVSAEHHRSSLLPGALERMKQTFDIDKGQSFVTICVSSVYEDSFRLNEAYDQVLELKKQRSFTDETEIIVQMRNPLEDYHTLPWREAEFDTNLREGNLKELLPHIYRVLHYMQKRNFTAEQFYMFAEEVSNKVLRTLHSLRLNPEPLGDPSAKIRDCYNVEELQGAFEMFLTKCTLLIKETKQKTDSITAFVCGYIERHFNEDITLELVAEKLNLSGGYLSTYFKEKTGKNFIDYLHEVRICEAKRLLTESNLKIQDVARKSGYHNMNSFHRMFKKYTGVTPSEFRRKEEALTASS